MALCFVSLIPLVKPHVTVDPNSEIMMYSLRYKKLVKPDCKPSPHSRQVSYSHKVNAQKPGLIHTLNVQQISKPVSNHCLNGCTFAHCHHCSFYSAHIHCALIIT